MAVKTVRVNTAAGAFRELERLVARERELIFRGHGDKSWRLASTLARHTRQGATELSIRGMNETLDHFFARLASVGKLPEKSMSARTRLEYARHYGVPSPLIDFTHSPYVALWLAFNGICPWDKGQVVVYALNPTGLAVLWQKYK
jgi:FRG domain